MNGATVISPPGPVPDDIHGGATAAGGHLASVFRKGLVLYICALVVRCVLIATVHWDLENDSAHYYNLAQEIRRGEYSSTIREPGYPAFVAVLATLGDRNLRAMYFIQAMIASLLPIISFRLYRMLLPGSDRLPFWLAMAVGVHPEIASFSGLLYREAIFCLLITWLAVRMLIAVRRPTPTNYAWVGLLGGCCSLIRTEALSFFCIFSAYALFRSVWAPWRAKLSLIGLACIMLVVGPWMYRNYRYHHFFGLTSAGGGALFVRTYYLDRGGKSEPELRTLAERTIREDGLTEDEVRQFLVPAGMIRRQKSSPSGFDEARLMRLLSNIAFENIRNHPIAYLIDSIKEFRSLFGGYSWFYAFPRWLDQPNFRQSIEERRWWVAAVKVLNGGVFPLVMWTLLAASLFYRPGSDDWKDSCFLLAAVLFYCAVISSIGFVENRFRDNYEPILFGICARGFLALTDRSRPGERRSPNH